MFKVCSRCGRIHDINKKCYAGSKHSDTQGNKIRRSYRWQQKSKEIRERSKYLCAVCKDNNRYIYNDLEVHHIIPINEDESKAFDNYNLICLCKQCHKQAEEGKIKKEYLFKLAKDREEYL